MSREDDFEAIWTRIAKALEDISYSLSMMRSK